jgi:hypothetical protein
MVVTALVSHAHIGPYVAVAVVGFVDQSVTAVPMLASVKEATVGAATYVVRNPVLQPLKLESPQSASFRFQQNEAQQYVVDAAVKATVGPLALFGTVRVVPQHRSAGVGVGMLESRRATSKDRTHARRFEPRLELRISSTDVVTIDRSGMHKVATTVVLLSMRSPRPILRTRQASVMPRAVAVLQLLTSPLKADAPSQMLAMLDAQAVLMSSLNVVLVIRIWYMLVTALVSHAHIGP